MIFGQVTTTAGQLRVAAVSAPHVDGDDPTEDRGVDVTDPIEHRPCVCVWDDQPAHCACAHEQDNFDGEDGWLTHPCAPTDEPYADVPPGHYVRDDVDYGEVIVAVDRE